MKFNYFKLIILSLTVGFLTSCGNDDNASETPMEMEEGEEPIELTLEEEQEQTVQDVTDGDAKTWKISQAILRNSNGEFEITNNFNVQDDEFVFKEVNGMYTLTWNKNHDVPPGASSVSDALLDYYLAPANFALAFEANSSTQFGNSSNDVLFEKTENSFTGTLKLSNDSDLDIILSEKTAADYETIPNDGLVFSEIVSFEAPVGFAQQRNVGFTGSYSDNSMFIAHRADCGGPIGADGLNLRSRILKLDVTTGTLIDNYSSFTDFFTRQLNVVNNELILTGGLKVYTYDLTISSEPSEVPYEIENPLSRYSTAVSGNDIYIAGGDLDAEIEANKIRKIDALSGELEEVATMPGSKIHAGSEIVNDNLYVFSGRQKFFDNSTVTTESYIYNLSDGSFETFDMPVALYNSYASRNGNLIYIAGDIQEDSDNDESVDNYDIWLGVYDTLTGEITEISHNLDDSDGGSYIQQLTVFNGKLYVIYGDAFASDDDPDCASSTWTILEASI